MDTIAQVYVDEIVHVKSLSAATDPSLNVYVSYNDLYLNTLTTSVQRVIAILTVLGRNSPLMGAFIPFYSDILLT